jgi:chromosome partitioning protein
MAMGRVICVCNQKGGVGKTTTSVNLASCLALSERRTLLIDLDPQANASSGMGIRLSPGEPSVYELLISKKSLQQIVRRTALQYLDMLPSSQDLIGAEVEFISLPSRERLLLSAIESIRYSYDYVFVDCPPSLGFLTLNALVAADSVLIPIQCEYYALEGVGNLLQTIRRVRSTFNQTLSIEGFLLTMFDPRNNLSHQVVEDVRKNLRSQVFDTIIPRNVKLSESPSFGKPVVLYDITSRGAISYLSLSKEIMDVEADGNRQEAYSFGSRS